jgi:hypothetical protein
MTRDLQLNQGTCSVLNIRSFRLLLYIKFRLKLNVDLFANFHE